MLYKTINGIKMRIQVSGKGNPVTLVHGLGASIEGMKPLISGMKNKFQVVAYDCRGHGRSEKPSSFSLNDHVEDLLKLLDELNIDKTALIGYSMGSYVAQAAAMRAPERFGKMVLVAPKARGSTSSVERVLKEAGTSIASASPLKRYFIMKKAVFAPETSFLKKVRVWSLRSPVRLTSAQSEAAAEAIKGFDFRSSLPFVSVRTLVCSGKYDSLNKPADGEEIARLLPNAIFVLFEKSGHNIFIEEEKLSLRVISRFINSP